MATVKTVDFERSRVARGIRTAAVALLLAAAAVMADHLLFVAPRTSATAAPVVAASTIPASPALDGFALPANLRPTAADVVTEAPGF